MGILAELFDHMRTQPSTANLYPQERLDAIRAKTLAGYRYQDTPELQRDTPEFKRFQEAYLAVVNFLSICEGHFHLPEQPKFETFGNVIHIYWNDNRIVVGGFSNNAVHLMHIKRGEQPDFGGVQFNNIRWEYADTTDEVVDKLCLLIVQCERDNTK